MALSDILLPMSPHTAREPRPAYPANRPYATLERARTGSEDAAGRPAQDTSFTVVCVVIPGIAWPRLNARASLCDSGA
ncbi:hypothetical protein PsYK624_142290 [Phanerochaete sordida]|uniref:Uncharacterized protein n=1 Tax=Phanerochaete sordida TaxID=48140 RepID=A0A9P3LL76_9APHY|nr:hypothetical protein PsYK624_142290 [Phanerochaete sordida]